MSFKNWWEETVVQWPWAMAIFILSMIIFNYLLLLFGKYKKKFSGKGKSTWKKLRHNISRDSLLVVHCYFFFFIYSFRAHSLLHEWLCVSGTLQQWRHASSLLPAHANRSLYFFFLFLCYTQLAVSLTFTKSKADTFLNMYILSFIFLFFLSLFFSSRFYPRLKSRHGRLMDVYSIGGKKEGILYVHLYKNHHGDIVLYAYRCPGTTLTGLANEN